MIIEPDLSLPGWIGWSDDEDHTLMELLAEGMPVRKIVRRLPGRTEKSIRTRIAHRGYQVRGLRASRSLRGVSLLFGVSPKQVQRWVERGWLKVYRDIKPKHARTQDVIPRAHFCVSDDHLMQFLECRISWVTWDANRITDPDWQAAALDIRAGAGGEWLNVRDVAARYGYSPSVVWDWIKLGILQATRITNSYYVWSADLNGFRPPINSGLWAGKHHKHKKAA